MREHEIPDLNIFMQAHSLDPSAFSPLPEGYRLRTLRRGELDEWKTIHFDREDLKREYYGYMSEYFERVYAPREELFFERCTVVCGADDRISAPALCGLRMGKSIPCIGSRS